MALLGGDKNSRCWLVGFGGHQLVEGAGSVEDVLVAELLAHPDVKGMGLGCFQPSPCLYLFRFSAYGLMVPRMAIRIPFLELASCQFIPDLLWILFLAERNSPMSSAASVPFSSKRKAGPSMLEL